MPTWAQIVKDLREVRAQAKAEGQHLLFARVVIHDDRRTRSVAALAVGWLVTEGVPVTVTYGAVGAHLELALSLEVA